MSVPEYWKVQKGPKLWLINAVVAGREVEFPVVVAEDESELDELVMFTLDHLKAQNG